METGEVPGDVRDTPEYEAAWDLEVWKVQEKRRFEQRMEEERLSLGRRFDEEMARREKQRAEAFDRQKSDVAKLSQRVARTLEELQKREDEVAAREAELNRKRSALVLEHEKKVRDAEDRVRHTHEEQYYKAEALQTKANELGAEKLLLEKRVEKLQADYDKVCDEFAMYKREQLLGQPDAASRSARVEALEAENRRLRDEAAASAERAGRAASQSAKHKNQVKRLAAEYNRLLAAAHRGQLEALEAEKAALRRAQALQEVAGHRQLQRELTLHEQQLAQWELRLRQQQAAFSAANNQTASADDPLPAFFTPESGQQRALSMPGQARRSPSAGAGEAPGALSSAKELRCLLREAEDAERGGGDRRRRPQQAAQQRQRRRVARTGSSSSGGGAGGSPPAAAAATVSSSGDEGSGGGGGGGFDDAGSATPPSAASSGGRPAARGPATRGPPAMPGVPPGADALASLRREAANRDRLLSTGVMTPGDHYIVQVTHSIRKKCAELGIDPEELS
ncbi:hypothetical protein DIPPA_18664 [Diplonema papillatum]|nr:hypothetical protein DIPPA_18664 [Diplonema papillatum]